MESKVPFYNIINIFLVGCVFFICISCIYPRYVVDVLANEQIVNLNSGLSVIITALAFACAYETGYIINRIGAILLDIILKKAKLVPFNDDYKAFNKAKEKYPIMEVLSREYASARTNVTLFIIVTVIGLFAKKYSISVMALACAVLFFASLRKHAKKIVELI